MTIIVPVKTELNTGEFIYGLASDLIYGPWTNPSVMESSKLFSQEDFVWGACILFSKANSLKIGG